MSTETRQLHPSSPNSQSWSKEISEREDSDLKQKRWEGILCLVIAFLFAALFICRSWFSPVVHLIFLAGISLILGLLLTIGKQCLKSADNPQTGLRTLIAKGLSAYVKAIGAVIIVTITAGLLIRYFCPALFG